MKENVFDVLMYLFENYMDEGPEFHPDQDALTDELTQAGFPRGEINKAFTWLEGLSRLRDQPSTPPPTAPDSLRHYARRERERLSVECRGFLLFLEQNGVLDALTRELVIDRAMALDVEEISLEQLKWVTLMVLVNQPGQGQNNEWLENLVFDELDGHLH
jgi:Smg protein